MSSFQYYEFYAIDRELTSKERSGVDNLSSRFSPTSRRAIFSYSYSDFRHDEEKVLIKYFDFFIYLASWGSKRLMFKFPKELVDYQILKQYDCEFDSGYGGDGISIYKKSKFVIIDISISEDSGDMWIEEESSWSSELIPLRQDILEGDYRSLFMVWLHFKSLELEYEQIGPEFEIAKEMIPANLATLNTGLRSLSELFCIASDWISGAAVYSTKAVPDKINYSEKIPKLSTEQKNDYLLRLLNGEDNLKIKLKKDIDHLFGKKTKRVAPKGKITIGELLVSVQKEEAKREKSAKRKANKERVKKLKETEKNKATILDEIHYHIQRKTGKSYAEAIDRIVNLKELAEHKKEEAEFAQWVKIFKERIKNKPSMIRRMEEIGL